MAQSKGFPRMSWQNQIKVWVGVLAITILMLWLFRGILLPFVAGLALAYLLDPVADRLEKWKFSRAWATLAIVFLAVMIVIGAVLLIVPLLVQQIVGLAERLPGYAGQLQALANQWAPEIYAFLGEERVAQFEDSLSSMLQQALGIAGSLTAQIMQSGLTIINGLALLVITPVVAFYMLLDWDRMVESANRLMPRQYRDEVHAVLGEIDRAMAGVIRGQGLVILLLSIFYSASLTIAGLSFGLAIGLIAGLLSFIPYVGFLVGFVLSLGIALVQFWPDWIMIGVIFGIFIIGQFLEGNVLYPKLVGSSIGVHPVWLMFSLFAFGLLFGTVGVLLAVPLSAVAGVMVRFIIRKYKASSLYLGDEMAEDPVTSAPGTASAPKRASTRSRRGTAK
jgi:predicted PurR-regulated permease PerM